jgi:protein TonB
MRHLLLLALMLLSSVTMTAQDDEQVALQDSTLESMPSFSGGQTALSQFLKDNVKYPPAAEANGVQGTVQVLFYVETDGTLRDVKVIKSVDPSLDKEAIRLVKSMPKWIPGKEKNGKLVVLPYVLPITFKLSNSK